MKTEFISLESSRISFAVDNCVCASVCLFAPCRGHLSHNIIRLFFW